MGCAGAPSHVEFDVVFREKVSLGMRLSQDLHVLSFVEGSAAEGRGVKAGDQLVAVNTESLVGGAQGERKTANGLVTGLAKLSVVLKTMSWPRRFKFRRIVQNTDAAVSNSGAKLGMQHPAPSTGTKPDTYSISAAGERSASGARDANPGDESNASLLRVLDAELGLIAEMEFLNALFGSWGSASDACPPFHVALTEPAHACSALTEPSSAQVRGKIAVVRRGSCSFLSKAWQAYENGAVGVVIVNSRDELVAISAPGKEDNA